MAIEGYSIHNSSHNGEIVYLFWTQQVVRRHSVWDFLTVWQIATDNSGVPASYSTSTSILHNFRLLQHLGKIEAPCTFRIKARRLPSLCEFSIFTLVALFVFVTFLPRGSNLAESSSKHFTQRLRELVFQGKRSIDTFFFTTAITMSNLIAFLSFYDVSGSIKWWKPW